MQKNWLVLTGAAAIVLLVVNLAPAQYQYGPNPYAGYEGSSFMQNPNPNQPVYYPYWYNYLDTMQRQGGYQAITGSYGNSGPVTAYYPSEPGSGQPAQQQQSPGQSSMYYNPGEYYANQGGTPPGKYQAQQPTAAQKPRATQKRSSKKRRISMKAQAAAQQQEQQYYQQQAAQQQQAYQQPQPYQQGQYNPSQQYYQQQQQAYQQQQYYNQQAYQQQAYQQQQAAQQQQGYPQQQQAPASQGEQSYEDPLVQRAQQKAYERALARQRAAELAAQQQSALQELQQAKNIFESAQLRVREQEDRQKAFQEEFHRKAVSDAYDSLRMAQQRYYDLMGVSSDNEQYGGYPTSGLPAAQQYSQPAGPAPAMQAPQQYSQGGIPAQRYGPPAQGGQPGYGAPQQPMPGGPAQMPPGQVTPLRVQQPPQEQSRGLWGTIKEILMPPSSGPSPRALIDGKRDAMNQAF